MKFEKIIGSEGGKARAKKLSPERRSEIAKKAASKRWKFNKKSMKKFKSTREKRQHEFLTEFGIKSSLHGVKNLSFNPTNLNKILNLLRHRGFVISKWDKLMKERNKRQQPNQFSRDER
jgi:hypothetical protein